MLKELRYELSRGMAYRQIRHGEMRAYTTWLPLGLWIILISIYLLLPQKPVLLGKDGTLSTVLLAISTLPGFYFAGLAAVATFGATAMDQEMPSPAPELDILVGGRTVQSKLTRRQFLSYLFSYLVIISFLLCLIMIMLNISTLSLHALKCKLHFLMFGEHIWQFGKLIAIMALGALFSTMATTTLQGIYFLTEKIHQP